MQLRTIRLSDPFIYSLIGLPESGMGYHVVRVFLKGGEILRKHKVLNSSILVLDKEDDFADIDIDKIELEN